MISFNRVLEIIGVVLQAITPFEVPLEEIQTIQVTPEELGLVWRNIDNHRSVGDEPRKAMEYVPSNVQDNPALVLLLHGFNGSPGTMFTAGVPQFRGVMDFADEMGFVIVAPEALRTEEKILGIRFRSWDTYGREGLAPVDADDMTFIEDVIDWSVLEHNVDRARVFVSGVSGGGSLIYRLINEKSHLFAAAAPLISLLPPEDLPPSIDYTPIPIVTLAGTRDLSYFYKGGRSMFFDSRSYDATLSYLAEMNGITTPRISENVVDINDCKVDHLYYETEGAPVEGYVVHGGGHYVPGTKLYLFYRPAHIGLFGPVKCETEYIFIDQLMEFFQRYGL